MARDATQETKRNYTAQESRDRYIEKMGEALGTQFSALWQEVANLHMSWSEYVELFGTKPSRIDLLNRAAPRFFRMLQEALWDETLLHIARLTDSPESGKGKSNLTIRNLPGLVGELAAKKAISDLVDAAVKETEFCRDWRNRHIAHRDLDLAVTDAALPLKAASRKQVKDALSSIANVLNALEAHYVNSTTYFKLGVGAGGAVSLLYVLDDGLKADVERMERLRRGEILEVDFARDL